MGTRWNAKPIEWIEDADGCHICTSHALDEEGYPRKRFRGQHRPMARIVWTQERGEIPDGMCVSNHREIPQ